MAILIQHECRHIDQISSLIEEFLRWLWSDTLKANNHTHQSALQDNAVIVGQFRSL